MEASISVKMTPKEYDVLRECLQTAIDQYGFAIEKLPSGKLKSDITKKHVLATELLRKLK